MPEKKRLTKMLLFQFFQLKNISRSYICRSYFLRPQCCKSLFFEDRTKNCILELRKTMSEDQQGVLLGVAARPAMGSAEVAVSEAASNTGIVAATIMASGTASAHVNKQVHMFIIELIFLLFKSHIQLLSCYTTYCFLIVEFRRSNTFVKRGKNTLYCKKEIQNHCIYIQQ